MNLEYNHPEEKTIYPFATFMAAKIDCLWPWLKRISAPLVTGGFHVDPAAKMSSSLWENSGYYAS
ncbi:MAG: hypothetical protein KKD96_07480 [Proteobacteria bacterium]|nr:hypothetical protein [Pseudomonadota bacterium]